MLKDTTDDIDTTTSETGEATLESCYWGAIEAYMKF